MPLQTKCFLLSILLCHKARLKTPNEGDICGNQQKIQATPRLPNTEKQINFTKYGLPFHQKLMPIGKPKNLIYIIALQELYSFFAGAEYLYLSL